AAAHPDPLDPGAHVDALRWEPAEGRARQVADHRAARADARRADARGRRGRQGRDLPPAFRRGAHRDRDPRLLFRDSRAADAERWDRGSVAGRRGGVARRRGGARADDRALRRGPPVTATAQAERRRTRLGDIAGGLWAASSRYAVVLVLLIAIFIFFSVSQENFLTKANIENLLASVAILLVVSIGMTFVVLTGGIDLSGG